MIAQTKIPHIVHFTNQHWMIKNFHCTNGFIVVQRKSNNSLKAFGAPL
jgi:hypothetical protein